MNLIGYGAAITLSLAAGYTLHGALTRPEVKTVTQVKTITVTPEACAKVIYIVDDWTHKGGASTYSLDDYNTASRQCLGMPI